MRESFALKGGVLLAAFDSRRPTKDVDLAGLNLANDTGTVLELVRSVLDVGPPQEDGMEFAADTATAEVIREEGDGVGHRRNSRASLEAVSRLQLSPEPTPHLTFCHTEGIENVLLGLGVLNNRKCPANFPPRGTRGHRLPDRLTECLVDGHRRTAAFAQIF